jgi:amino acid transporter
MALSTLQRVLVGPPLPTRSVVDERLGNFRALAALSPDALASVAYANQEIFLGLVVAGAAGLAYSWTIALAIAGLLTMLALSYSQTISAYPNGGGSYTVARENLGLRFGLVAAGALMTDYVLNAAVSATAGVAAVVSVFPALWPYRTLLALILLAVITLANLRGIRESGTLMAVPVYLFLFTFLTMIAVGLARAAVGEPAPLAATAPPATESLTLMLVLHAFAAGCTALTGIEAISNGVTVFKPPQSRHANQTIAAMAVLMGTLFLGTVGLSQFFAVVPGPEETILSALARHVFGGQGVAYLAVQASTVLMLMVAANTSFMGFPRLASIIASDGHLPRQLALLGDRLVYSNGILLLAGLAGLLILLFGGETHALIPLFAVGAFLAFTLSQTGMVFHWARERGPGWRVKAVVNGLGALATLTALLIIGVSKFVRGAWIIILLLPALVLMFHAIKKHYHTVAEQLSLNGSRPEEWTGLAADRRLKIVVPISGIHQGTLAALRFARLLSRDVTAVIIDIDPKTTARVEEKWPEWGHDVPLVRLDSPYRSIVGPLLDYLEKADRREPERGLAVVVLPEFVPAHWWHALLHNQTAHLIKSTVIYRHEHANKNRVLIDVPYHLTRKTLPRSTFFNAQAENQE